MPRTSLSCSPMASTIPEQPLWKLDSKPKTGVSASILSALAHRPAQNLPLVVCNSKAVNNWVAADLGGADSAVVAARRLMAQEAVGMARADMVEGVTAAGAMAVVSAHELTRQPSSKSPI